MNNKFQNRWRLVPVEPTEEMLNEAGRNMSVQESPGFYEAIYKAMLDKAPVFSQIQIDDLKAKHMKFLHDKINEASRHIDSANEYEVHKIPFWHEQINGYRADLMKLMQEENSNG